MRRTTSSTTPSGACVRSLRSGQMEATRVRAFLTSTSQVLVTSMSTARSMCAETRSRRTSPGHTRRLSAMSTVGRETLAHGCTAALARSSMTSRSTPGSSGRSSSSCLKVRSSILYRRRPSGTRRLPSVSTLRVRTRVVRPRLMIGLRQGGSCLPVNRLRSENAERTPRRASVACTRNGGPRF